MERSTLRRPGRRRRKQPHTMEVLTKPCRIPKKQAVQEAIAACRPCFYRHWSCHHFRGSHDVMWMSLPRYATRSQCSNGTWREIDRWLVPPAFMFHVRGLSTHDVMYRTWNRGINHRMFIRREIWEQRYAFSATPPLLYLRRVKRLTQNTMYPPAGWKCPWPNLAQ